MNTTKAEGRGGFGVGAMTAGRFAQVAADFAGDGAPISRSGRALVSADNTFVARFPQPKNYGGSTSRMTGNLEIKNKAGQPVINAHVPIVLGPAP